MRNLARKPTDDDLVDVRQGPAAMQHPTAVPGGMAMIGQADTAIDRGLAMASRCAGPLALGAAYMVAARMMLGG